MIPRTQKHWSSLLGPCLQATELHFSQSQDWESDRDNRLKICEAIRLFRAHQISDEARKLIRTEALAELDAFLQVQGRIIYPFLKKYYLDGIHNNPELESILG